MSFQELFGISGLRLAALFFFSAASFGFLFFMIRHPRGSEVRRVGIRFAHATGFVGTAVLAWSEGRIDEVTLAIGLSLVASLLGFELTQRFLR